MKKQFIYTGMFLAAIGFSACNEDYTDWADPQSNPQEEPAGQLTVTYAAGKDANITMDTATADSVEIAKISSTTAGEGSKIVVNSLTVNESHSLPCVLTEDNAFKVALAQLDSVAQEAYKSRASVARELKLTINASAVTPSGDGILLPGNEVSISLKPAATPAIDPDGYYVVGDFTGWNAAGAQPMSKDGLDENLYTLETEIDSKSNFKIFPASAIGEEIDWGQALGSYADGDESGDNFITWTNAGAINTALKGRIKITFDALNYRFTVKDNSAPTELYMTGSAYSWGGVWNELVPVNGTKGAFWGIFHFAANDEVKFAPQAGWGNDFGFTDAISQESKDRAGLSDAGGNLKVGNAGWYLVYVSVIGDDKAVEFEQPDVYLMGETSYDGWNAQLAEQDLFAVPATADGEFVSPAFLTGGAVRICVHPKAVADWWRTEFIIFDGQIAYRGNGGDQAPVQGTAGQKVYLNFGSGTGRIE